MNPDVQRNADGVIDPTANVMALVSAAVKRLDDLNAANMQRIEEQVVLHTGYAKQLSEAEAKRIDAIRAVDVGAAAVDREKATQQAAVLANQVVTSAETLRTLVASTAEAQASAQAQLFSPILDRLALLEKSQYESKGRSGISAPLLVLIATFVGGLVVFLVQQVLGHK